MLGGLGISIVSTSAGIMTDAQAAQEGSRRRSHRHSSLNRRSTQTQCHVLQRNPSRCPKASSARSQADAITVKGPKGTLEADAPAGVDVAVQRQRSPAEAPKDRHDTKMAGTTRALISNMVKGVSEGYRAQARARRRRLSRRAAGQGSEPDARLLASGRVQGAGRHHDRQCRRRPKS